MKLTVTSRVSGKKSDAKKLRRENKIPAILYSEGKEGQPIVIDGIEFQKVLNKTPSGYLPTTIFELDVEGKKVKAIVKEVDYHPTTYNIRHLDFFELLEKRPVKVNVPISCAGLVDCVGVKQGGVVRQTIRHLRVECDPKDIPTDFTIDVKNLNMGESLKLNSVVLPNTVKTLVDLKEIAVVVGKK